MVKAHFHKIITLAVLTIAARSAVAAPGYDPLTVPAGFKAETVLLDVVDTGRQRTIPIKAYLPPAKTASPVVLFSHGLGGSRENDKFLGEQWAGRGYVAVFVQHPGSDESVWKGKNPTEIRGDLKRAASAQNMLLRVKDIPAVLNQLEKWNGDTTSPLRGRLDLKHVGMSGHSFGAVTTQAVSGQNFGRLGGGMTEPRISAACMFSPSVPKRGDANTAFGSVKIPWMLMTGTKDTSPIGDTAVEDRLRVYPALPAGAKYQVVLEGAEHSAFGDRPLPGDKEGRNPNHHKVMLALTTAFWDAYLKGDGAAKAWLDGTGPRGVLEEKDSWDRK